MSNTSVPIEDYRGFAIASWLLALGGWAGLYFIIFRTVPTPGPRWLFFVVALMALTGTAAPFVRYLNKRFARGPVAAAVLLRQSLWVGFFCATCAWLELGRTLNLPTALLLAAGLAGIEWFLRMRERARWDPGLDDEPA
jgi:hypothetical protein